MGRSERPTRRQAKRARREAKMRQSVLIGTIITVLAVVGLIGYGFLNETYIRPNKTVAFINGEEITVGQFQNRVLFDYFFQTGGQPQQGLTAEFIAGQTYDNMVREIVIRQAAEERGIDVTDAEVDEEAELAFGYDAGDPEPTRTPFPTPEPTEMPTETPTFVFTVTPSLTPTIEEGVTPSPTITPTATLDGTPTQTPTGTITPTPTPVTEEDYNEALDNFTTTFGVATELTEAETLTIYLNRVANTIYERELLEELEFEVEEQRTQVLAQHILVETEEEAEDILGMLDDGEDFGELAAEFSSDGTAYQGGNLGWFGEGQMVAPFEEAAFDAEVGEIVGPVETDFGWHLIKVNDRAEVDLNFFELQQAEQTQFIDFVNELVEEAEIDTVNAWEEFIPEIPGLAPASPIIVP